MVPYLFAAICVLVVIANSMGALAISMRVSEDEVKSCSSFHHASPVPVSIFAPTAAGSYPVILFVHGFHTAGQYTTMLKEISSGSFIVVAPRMRESWIDSDATPEIQQSVMVMEWMQKFLEAFIKQCMGLKAFPDFSHLVAMGHSKGGKVAFALARGIQSNVNHQLAAVIGIDPVDGSRGSFTEPPVLEYEGNLQFHLPFPALLIGSGLGPLRLILAPACAPEEFGYKAFFANSSSLVFKFWAENDGHLDFLDDVQGFLSCAVCRCHSRTRARAIASHTVVAFLRAALHGECVEFNNCLEGPEFIASSGSSNLCGLFASA